MKKFPFHIILHWYKENGRSELPWREYNNFSRKEIGYRVWLSEIILQQTQASRGAEYFEKIVKKYPTVETLAATSYDVFFEDYKGLGYYSRARNMLKTAQIVTEDFGGIFPDTTGELTSLPGVGPYTAEAIKAFAYDKPTLSFDTNLLKIFSRYYYGDKTQKLSKAELQNISDQYLKTNISPRDINNAFMDFASLISKNDTANIDWKNYPLTDSKFYKTRGELEPIKKKKKTSFPSTQAKVIIILHENHKEYFSKTEEKYSPFILQKSDVNSREYAKKFFKDNYNLDISVRPPHTKYNEAGKCYLVCYAQIQKGENPFFIHSGIKKREKEIIDNYNI